MTENNRYRTRHDGDNNSKILQNETGIERDRDRKRHGDRDEDKKRQGWTKTWRQG